MNLMWYYSWALGQKGLGYVPFGRNLYSLAGSVAYRNKRGTSSSYYTSFRLTQKAKELVPSGGTIVDVGTGWFHHDAFLLWLVGDYKIHLFDVSDKARLTYIRNFMKHLKNHIDRVVQELDVDKETILDKLEQVLQMRSRAEIYEMCNFVPYITDKPDEPFLPDNSVDFMVSNCVLTHIPPKILAPELLALRHMLKPEGRMYFLVGHDDHWTFHDKTANIFNYYRYSDSYYRRFFETSFEYQNRYVKGEWEEIFDSCELDIESYGADIDEECREAISSLDRIDPRFAKYPCDELAIRRSYFLLRK